MVRKDKVLDFETARESDRRCDFVGCKEHGLYKAPKSREQLNEYFWFCMDHIRAYNRSWNYYRGMDELELEAEIRNDTVWRRPTWPMGGKPKAPRHPGNGPGFDDPFGVFDDTGPGAEARPERETYDASVRRSFRIMEITPPTTLTELKSRYKELVKKLHPDVNGGDPVAEDRLKEINLAYAALKKVVPA
jgi:hypothetical protein